MTNLKEFPRAFGRLDERIRALRDQIEKETDAAAIGRAAAPIYLDCISRTLACWEQLDQILDFELFQLDLTLEENIPRASTGLRMMSELNAMLMKQIEAFIKCFGGPLVIAVQQIEEWSSKHKARQDFVQSLASAAVHAKRSRRRSARSTESS